MNSKFTALPIILALAAGGCSNQPSYYPNFQACYNDTGDANQCLQYIDENGRTSTVDSSNYTDSSQMSSNSDQNDSGIDGSSALTGAAVGAAAGYVAGSSMNNNRNNYSDSERQRQDRVYAAGTNTTRPVNSGNNSNNKSSTTSSNSKVNLSKSTPSKSSTSRGGFGSTGSKSFGG